MSGSLKSGYVIGGRYTIERYLAEGGMQFVYIAVDKLTSRRVALKTPKNKSAQKRFKRSAIVAAKVNHPNVAKTLDYVRVGDDRFLIEELVEGQDLKSALLGNTSFLDPYLAAKVFHYLAKGVAAAHHAGVIHRDLKPTNIMVVGDYSLTGLKVTDFGIAKLAGNEIEDAVEGGEESMTSSQTAIGALPYMAPEAIERPKEVGAPADIWSLGAMMYQLLCGSYPFGQGWKAIPHILNAKFPSPPAFLTSNPQFAPLALELMEIVSLCLKKDEGIRPTADELVAKCSELCYTPTARHLGEVNNVLHDKYGFITAPLGNIFYHHESVYGPIPKKGDKVMFSSYVGGGANRALPVVKLNGL